MEFVSVRMPCIIGLLTAHAQTEEKSVTGVDWINLAQSKGKWRARLNTVGYEFSGSLKLRLY